MDNTVEVQELGKVMITPKGEYSLSKSYEILDAVSYNGSSYVSKINDNTSVPTSDAWQLLAQKGDIYDVTEEDLQRIAEQITSNANSAFNQNVKEKTDGFNSNANSKTEAYNTNATEKLGTYNSNHTAKLKEYNDNATSKLSAYNTNTVTKTTEYNSNHTNKLNAYNTNADSKIEEYNTNANSKILEYDKHSEELRNMAVSTDNELERVKNEILDTGSASDTFIHVEDSCMAKLKELEIEGVFEQETTIGKNLLNVPKNLQQIKSNSYSITPVYSNGMLKYIELNGTFDKWVRYSILGAEFTLSPGTYVQSFHKEGTFSNGSVYIDSSLSITSIESDNYLKVLSDDLNILKYDICVNEGTICNNLKLYPMLAKEGKASNYEPFTNGASPNPDYPQEIRTITDSLKVTSCGKNLVERMVIGELNTRTGIFEKSSTIICNEHYIPYDSLNRYYIKVDNASATANIRWYNQKFEYIGYGTTQSSGLINKYVYTDLTLSIPSDTTPKYFKIRRADVTLLNSTWCVSTDQNYFGEYVESLIEVKLHEDEFIGKLDDHYKDTLSFKYDSNDSMVHVILNKMIGKIILNNKSIKSIFNNNLENVIGFRTVTDYIPTVSTKLISNYFTCDEVGILWNADKPGIGYSMTGNYLALYINRNIANSLAEINDWLSTHDVEVYYALKNPYTRELGTIKMPLAYKEHTNIFTNSDLLPKITAKYYRTFQTTIQNMQINEKSLKQEITDLNNNISDITKRLEALESANASTVEESEA